jgi:hypothetical protein
MKLTWDQVVRWRLHRDHLGSDKARDPVAVAASKIDKLLYEDPRARAHLAARAQRPVRRQPASPSASHRR